MCSNGGVGFGVGGIGDDNGVGGVGGGGGGGDDSDEIVARGPQGIYITPCHFGFCVLKSLT